MDDQDDDDSSSWALPTIIRKQRAMIYDFEKPKRKKNLLP
jgi:hypothetical protein